MNRIVTTLVISVVLLALGCMYSCEDGADITTMDISKYRGYVITKEIQDGYKYSDTYIFKKGDTIRKATVPVIFSYVFKVGDTIK